jgi:Tol biopolymer transport system component
VSNSKTYHYQSPSFWHGWSPKSEELVYVGFRNGNFDIFTIFVAGVEEKKLTFAKVHVDSPDYSSDGNYIYYNSMKSGRMESWRMLTDGNDQILMTKIHIQIGSLILLLTVMLLFFSPI